MKLIEGVQQYEKCMKKIDAVPSCDGCPLKGDMRLSFGQKTDDFGGILWTISGCNLMEKFESWLKNKKFSKAFKKVE